MSDEDEFWIWLNNGIGRGWVSKIHCYVHDGPELTDGEAQLVDDEGDMDAICVPIVRIWGDSIAANSDAEVRQIR